jgi:hypothetical protein
MPQRCMFQVAVLGMPCDIRARAVTPYRATKHARSELAVGHNLVGHERGDFLDEVERYAVKRFNKPTAAACHIDVILVHTQGASLPKFQ